ncbi:MAG: hypothetical protein COV10_03350 [Candidatus Vogelbacteria bacterium CG10_big_fil_rev_8_21_14_0_10_51_16]|uniref:Uncharacterized protein n=1 Tax=Candidatus Vogelbacteria bacterium CG10_big_fil_rev_8_21_14_0_10_51_16 TaxID=1975045 RepID=A0A2H0RDY9_9BACT|nr:MAG: hypothetical protein COV10_03350 [Candidatus Vogelbacteria bacterium CG10_big_fil_rev_8_21_14_0_10_51_16]
MKESGDLEFALRLVDAEADVWVQRGDGSWQIGKAVHVAHPGLFVEVQFVDKQTGGTKSKPVDTETFVRWQREAHIQE